MVNNADLVLADGFPIYLAQKLLGNQNSGHIRGVDLTIELTKFSQKKEIKWLIGGAEYTMKAIVNIFKSKYQVKTIEYHYSPPFRELTDNEK